MDEHDKKKFDECCLKASEFFEDFLIIIKPRNGGCVWRARDQTWAIGAAERYIHHTRADDVLDLQDHRRNNET